ncbi:hypothetical protein M8994_00005 [Brucella sp. 21LCYQ03]|nr:hypothetical protein [Brucella sp. 21LCYQ03]
MIDGKFLLTIGTAITILCHDRVGSAAMLALEQSTEQVGWAMRLVQAVGCCVAEKCDVIAVENSS